MVAAGPCPKAIWALPYYWDTNPGIVRQASNALAQVLADGALVILTARGNRVAVRPQNLGLLGPPEHD